MRPSIAASSLNRLLNFVDELDALDVPPAPPAIGDSIDAALAAPTQELPADPALAEAAMLEGLDLAPAP